MHVYTVGTSLDTFLYFLYAISRPGVMLSSGRTTP